MNSHNFNKQHIEQIPTEKLTALVRSLWMWKAKDGIRLVQRALNSLDAGLEVDGWLGDKSIAAIEKLGVFPVHSAVIYEISKLQEVQEPVWITIAKAELGVKEIKGSKHNARVVKYHSTSYGKYKTDEVPWCGSFVNWVMLEAGVSETVKYPERAKAWRNFGIITEGNEPTQGCIAIKSRKGGGHVCFVVGKSEDDKYLYCLGGNQNDAVTIRKYKASVFTDFRLPLYAEPIKLAVYDGDVKGGGSEV